jgi:hypothetical protein
METAKSKGKRGIATLAFGLFIVILAPAIGSLTGHALISNSDNSHVLAPNSVTQFIFNSSGSGIAFAEINGTVTFDMPVNQSVAYVLTNVTVGEMNDYSVSRMAELFGSPVFVNETLGFGTNSSNFQPFLNVTASNTTQENVSVGPQYLTGNQSSYLMFRLSGKETSYSFSFSLYGNNQFSFLGPFAGEQVAYLIAGIMIIGAAALQAPWYDLEVNGKHEEPKKKRASAGKKGGE